MNFIQPIIRPINYNTLLEWQSLYEDSRYKYENFIYQMLQQQISETKAQEMWLHNFGVIPPIQPDRLYQCNIICPDIKLIVTVLKRNSMIAGQRKYDVIKLNQLILDNYDYKREMAKNDKGEIIFKITPKGFAQPINNYTLIQDNDYLHFEYEKATTSYPLNYEDSNWFTNLHIADILGRLKLKINEYTGTDGELTLPNLFIYNMNLMRSSNFEFVDKDFEQKLYDMINNKFLEIESELR